MNKTYFAPTTSEVELIGDSYILSGSPIGDHPSDPPQDPILSAPARKLYV